VVCIASAPPVRPSVRADHAGFPLLLLICENAPNNEPGSTKINCLNSCISSSQPGVKIGADHDPQLHHV
jgi:hypothetical protein